MTMNNEQIAQVYVALKNAQYWMKQVARETDRAWESPLTSLEVKEALEILMKEHQKDIEERLV